VGTNVDIDQLNTQNRVSGQPESPTSVNQYGVTVKKLMGFPCLCCPCIRQMELTLDSSWETSQPSVLTTLLRVPELDKSLAWRYGLCYARMGEAGPADQTQSHCFRPEQRCPAAGAVNPAGRIGVTRSQGPTVYLCGAAQENWSMQRNSANHCSPKSR
jgi:hypothetical protein